MGLAVGFSEDKGALVSVVPPCGEDLVRQVDELLRIFGRDTHHRHGPLYNARLHVLEAREDDWRLHRGFLHSEGVVSALEMVVGQDGAAHDGQVGIGAHKVVGELTNEVQQLGETGSVNLHGGMDAVQADTVLVIIDIGRIL